MKGHVLVTGGAGYIGSHVVRRLHEDGRDTVVVDTLDTGFRGAVLHGELVVGDVSDGALVRDVLRRFRVTSVLHLAAHASVAESVADPLRYYRNNTAASCALIESCVAEGVEHFIFSSSAAVYGAPATPLVGEATPAQPISPYGASKLMSERILRDVSAATGMRCTILRYFNVAGADPKSRIGQSTRRTTALVKVACETALGKREHMFIHGTDYPTPDGTCVRDFIHVEDLANVHVHVLRSLEAAPSRRPSTAAMAGATASARSLPRSREPPASPSMYGRPPAAGVIRLVSWPIRGASGNSSGGHPNSTISTGSPRHRSPGNAVVMAQHDIPDTAP